MIGRVVGTLIVSIAYFAGTSVADEIEVTGDGIRFSVNEIQFLYSFEDREAETGVLVLLEGQLLSNTDRCIHGFDFKLIISGQEHEASTVWMDRFQDSLDGIDYPGWGITGQCFDAGVSTPTFLVFDVPIPGEDATLRFFEGELALGHWTDLIPTVTPTPISTATKTASRTFTPTPTSTATAIPTVTSTKTPVSEEFTATGNANVRSCPQTTCEIVAGVVLGQRIVKIGEAEGAMVGASNIWYEIRFADGSTGFIHSNFVRFGTPRPAPLFVQPRATSGGGIDPATSLAPTQEGDQWVCFGDRYNCSDFEGRRDALHSYWNACPGDPSRLDQGGVKGIPCETIW